jgi:hypothetical protein
VCSSDLNVKVLWYDPEPVVADKIVPQIVVKRGTVTPDLVRWNPYGYDYVYAENNLVYTKDETFPFMINYSVDAMARLNRDAVKLTSAITHKLKPYSPLYVKDSLGQFRVYEMFMTGFDYSGDLVNVVYRIPAYTMNIDVVGELDLTMPSVMVYKRVVQARVTLIGS